MSVESPDLQEKERTEETEISENSETPSTKKVEGLGNKFENAAKDTPEINQEINDEIDSSIDEIMPDDSGISEILKISLKESSKEEKDKNLKEGIDKLGWDIDINNPIQREKFLYDNILGKSIT